MFLPTTRQDLTQRQMTRIIVGVREGEGRTQAEAGALLVYAGYRPTKCNVGLMSLVRHGLKPES